MPAVSDSSTLLRRRYAVSKASVGMSADAPGMSACATSHENTCEKCRLVRCRSFQVAAQILTDLLATLLDFEQDRLRHSSVVLTRMYLPRLQKNSPQIADALLREQHLVVGLDHGSSSSTIPRFRKLLDV